MIKLLALLAVGGAYAGGGGGGGSSHNHRRSGGCGKAVPGTVTPGSTTTVAIDGRTYNIHVPASYDIDVAMPVVYAFHGYTSTAEGIERRTGWSEVGEVENFIAVYPEAVQFPDPRGYYDFVSSWNDGACSAGDPDICVSNIWAYPPDPNCSTNPGPCDWCHCGDDVGFIENVMDDVNAALCVDRKRVFASGFSNGGMFTNRLACDIANRLAAVAPVSGTLPPGHLCASNNNDISIMQVASAGDPWVPNSGLIIHIAAGGDTYKYSSIQDASAVWADKQQCDVDSFEVMSTTPDGRSGWSCSKRTGCNHDSTNAYCLWDGGGHEYPSDPATDNYWGSEAMWEFFVDNSPPPE